MSLARYANRVDQNQAEIIEALRRVGCTVQLLTRVGAGCPDVLVARGGHMLHGEMVGGQLWLMEIKTDGGTLNAAQIQWRQNWACRVHTVRSIDAALSIVGLAKAKATA